MNGSLQTGQTLKAFLSVSAPESLARVLMAIGATAISLAQVIRLGQLSAEPNAEVGPAHDGVAQKALDVLADDYYLSGLKTAEVRAVLSEERDEPTLLDPAGAFLVAIDPLDGSNNIDANVSIGTLFSVLDAQPEPVASGHFLQHGEKQRAGGFVLFGPQTVFVFTVGSGVHMAILDPRADAFHMARIGARIVEATPEFAINVSNFRHWPPPVRAYVEDCLEGAEGPRSRNLNMRWVGSVVADVYRILVRGGVYLYPQDSRDGYEHGRLRLLYEANPIAFLIEQAGGAAIDGFQRILEIAPRSLHMRTPLIFGSTDKVARIERYYREGAVLERAPLFVKRGLLRR